MIVGLGLGFEFGFRLGSGFGLELWGVGFGVEICLPFSATCLDFVSFRCTTLSLQTKIAIEYYLFLSPIGS